MKWLIAAVLAGGLLTGCVLLSPPEPQGAGNTSAGPQRGQSRAAPPEAPAAQPGAPGGVPAPGEPGRQGPRERTFTLGAAAGALVGAAHAQEQSRNFGLAAETLERALSIEPRNPLVWIELGRENILAGNPAQAYGMGRKAVYLASGDPRAQASAWELVAASLRAQGRNDEAYVAEQKAVSLSPRDN